MPLLEIEGLQASYGQVKALHGISMEVGEGNIVAMLGANGAGKTTTLRAISGLIRRTGGVRFNGRPIDRESAENIVRMGVAHVPENRGLFGQFTVWDNLRMGAYLRRDTDTLKEDFQKAFDNFPRLGERRTQLAATLSGGEQQMLAIARGLMLRPRLLLLDEPSLGLAPLIVQEIFQIIRSINRDGGTTVLLVEQNAAIALSVSQHAYVLETGQVAVSGTPEELRQNEGLQKSYLGY
jgi:branched-chain amino acid transport system ATP-binding protein